MPIESKTAKHIAKHVLQFPRQKNRMWTQDTRGGQHRLPGCLVQYKVVEHVDYLQNQLILLLSLC